MDRDKLEAAVLEAERFIRAAKSLPNPEPYHSGSHIFVNNNFPRESGAIRRASMDLTRSLADLRKPS